MAHVPWYPRPALPPLGKVFTLNIEPGCFGTTFLLPEESKNWRLESPIITEPVNLEVKLIRSPASFDKSKAEVMVNAFLPWEALAALRSEFSTNARRGPVLLSNKSVTNETLFLNGNERWPVQLAWVNDGTLVALMGWSVGDGTSTEGMFLVPADFDESLLY